MRIECCAVLAIAGLSQTVSASHSDKRVEVEGSTYRVHVDGDVVTVAKKALVARFNIDERDRMRAAVAKATGCRVTDEIPNGGKLKGKLDCSAISPAKP